ncbi:hypothetical protein BESB_080100 [Besnoitia besnoiti]|uniref:Transmembrane protein n=1 Tax=Besnoitia besnoiti TaxID=94643 RepID=A0A2A9M9B8_BESBE|nr:hypothetical protein BESB_080100 [Besnoitia besnoiti]PFH33794.1 hypothetical protein BESB_080100 [Besnoitia besnoiti]
MDVCRLLLFVFLVLLNNWPLYFVEAAREKDVQRETGQTHQRHSQLRVQRNGVVPPTNEGNTGRSASLESLFNSSEETEACSGHAPARRHRRSGKKRDGRARPRDFHPPLSKRLPSRKDSLLPVLGVAAAILLFSALERRRGAGAEKTSLRHPELFVPLEILPDIPLPFMAQEDNTLQIVTGATVVKRVSPGEPQQPLLKWEWTSVNLVIPGLPVRPLRTAERGAIDGRVFRDPSIPRAFHIAPKADLERQTVTFYHPDVQDGRVSYRIETKPLDTAYRALEQQRSQAVQRGAEFISNMNVKGFWFPPPPEGHTPSPIVHLRNEKVTVFEVNPEAPGRLTQRTERLQLSTTAAAMSQMTAWSVGRWLIAKTE